MIKTRIEINAGSMADIAFLLLIFFLVTTTMDIDTGISRKLPPLPKGEIPPYKKRNIMKVLIHSSDQLMVSDKACDIIFLKELVMEFFVNPNENITLSERKVKYISGLGDTTEVSKGIISLKNDRGTSYEMYIQVQNEIAASFHEMRNKFSVLHFGVSYDDLRDKKKIEAVRMAIPLAISEAEPENFGGN